MDSPDPVACLGACATIDHRHPAVRALAAELLHTDALATARTAFLWVRDNVRHSLDFQCTEMPWRASDVLAAGSGLCFAKAHLLVALLRANGLPAALGYQRLLRSDPPPGSPTHGLHGFAAVWLDGHGWYRCDPRGNTKPGIRCEFEFPEESLAYIPSGDGELTFPGLWVEPLPAVLAAIRASHDWQSYRACPADYWPSGDGLS